MLVTPPTNGALPEEQPISSRPRAFNRRRQDSPVCQDQNPAPKRYCPNSRRNLFAVPIFSDDDEVLFNAVSSSVEPSSSVKVSGLQSISAIPVPTDVPAANIYRKTNKEGNDFYETDDEVSISGDQVSRAPVKRIRKKKSVPPANPTPFQLFEGIEVQAKKGKHPCILYRQPGSEDLCYAFQFHRENKKKGNTYACSGCKEEKFHTKIELLNSEFLADPASLNHKCTPITFANEMAKRKLYHTTQALRTSGSTVKPYNAYRDLLAEIHTDSALHGKEQQDIGESLGTYEKIRKTLSKAVNSHKDRFTTLLNIPKELSVTYQSDVYLQFHSYSLIVFFSHATLSSVAPFMSVLVADGCHDYQPKELGKHGQLYTIHAALQGGGSIPIVHCITGSKSKTTYKKIFTMVSKAFKESGYEKDLRIVLDFERGAIEAAKEVFGPGSVSGCAFHFAQALNRRRNKEGIEKYIDEAGGDQAVRQWYGRILALTFLPLDLFELTDVTTNPVPQNHPAFSSCQNFIQYFKDNWINGPFKGLWQKFGKEEHRTTNLAESYHRKLDTVFNGSDHPPLSDLLKHFRMDNLESTTIINQRITGAPGKKLRTKDQERRKTVNDKMMEFSKKMAYSEITRANVKEYLDDMAHHQTRRAFH